MPSLSRFLACCRTFVSCCAIRLTALLLPASLAAQVTPQTVDAGGSGDVGQYATMAIVAGNPAVAYYNATDGNLLFARNSAANGSGTWTVTSVATTGDVGRGASLAVVNGNPAIAYCDTTNGIVKFSRNSAADGSGTWSTITVNFGTGSVTDLALVFLGNSRPAVAYYDSTNGNLWFGVNDAADGSGSWTLTVIASTGDQGKGVALAVLPNGRPAVAFMDVTNRALKFAVNSTAGGTGTWTTTTAVNLSGAAALGKCSLAIVNGRPAISYSYRIIQNNWDSLSYARNTAADGSGTWTAGPWVEFGANQHSLADVGGKPVIAFDRYVVRGSTADGGTFTQTAVGSSTVDSTFLLVVGGNPAIAYHEGGDLLFARNSAADASGTWTPTTADGGTLASGVTGQFTSLAVVSGTPAIGYYDASSGDLKYTRNASANGSGAWTTATVDSAGDVGKHASLLVVGGNPALAYHDSTNSALKFARNSNATGTGTWTLATIETVQSLGTLTFPSLALVDGRPAIAYAKNQSTGSVLRFARNSAADGTGTWTLTTVDTPGNALGTGTFASLAVVNGTPAIAYYDSVATALKFARNSAADGSGTWTLATVDNTADQGRHASLAIVGGLPAIAYYDTTNTALKFARNSAADGSGTWTLTTIDNTAAVGEYARLALVNGFPTIAYFDATNGDLKLARNTAADASGTWTITTPDATAGATVGQHASLAALGFAAGLAYYDATASDLKFAYVPGPEPEISVEQPALTVLASGATKHFGSIALGASATAVTFTIRNSGAADLTGLALTKDGAHAADFAVSALGSTTLAPGATATFTVTFTPGAAEFRTAVLHLASNDADENPSDLILTGVGTSAAPVWAAQQALAKPRVVGTTQAGDQFGFAVAMSGDTVVVGAPLEDSGTIAVNSTPSETAADAGAAYVFVRSGTTWTQQAYLKASNAGAGDQFGSSVAISADTIIVGAWQEDGSATTVNGTSDNNLADAGAAYVFVRSGTTWTQQAYLKPSHSSSNDWFGHAVAISGDTAVVTALTEDSSTKGVNSTPNESASNSGAAFVFVRSGTTWTQQAYLKSDKTAADQNFGYAVGIDGNTLVVGSGSEDGSNTGVNSTYVAGSIFSGAAYVFQRTGTSWAQQAYLKPSVVHAADVFGRAVAISGNTVAVGAPGEDSSTTGINSTPNTSLSGAGAVYVFTRSGTLWTEQAYVKAHNPGAQDQFGTAVSLSGDALLVGASGEASSTSGVGSTSNESAAEAGAVYLFSRGGTTWAQRAYVKSGNPGAGDHFGRAVSMSGLSFAVGAEAEDSSATGISPTPNETANGAGAAYFFLGFTTNPVPSISDVANTSTNEDTATSALAVTLADADTSAASLTLTAASSNTTLVPNTNFVFGGSGANRTVTVTPAANQSGTATITLTVSDGTNTATDTFVLTVNAVNDAPTISSIADTTTVAGTATAALAFTVGDVETAAGSLTVTATSSNTTLVPNANLVLGGSGANRTLTVTPAGSLTGTTTITVTVSDGTASASDTFVLTVNANTLVVTNANNSGAGSLRQALTDLPAGGTITFAPTFFATPRTITLSSTITLTKAVTITGPGATKLTISGNDAVRCFSMESVASVTFSDLTIAHGRAAAGGAIYAGSTPLALTRCVFQQNAATSAGGAVFNDFGTLTATDCTFTGNTSVDPGAAIASDSSLAGQAVLTGCTFTAQTGAVESLYLQDGTGCVVTNCTFSDNTGSLVGAMTLRNTGVTLTNCTIVANTGAKAVFVIGTSVVVMKNCVVAGNSSYDYAGEALAAGSINNLIGTTDAHGLVDGVNGNRIGVTDPLLAPLGNYGGPTPTRPPYATSLALDAGTATGAPATDQRGVARPQGAAVDLGAVERSVALTPTTVPGVAQNSAYPSVTFGASGGTAPYTWTLLTGALPAGMTFNAGTQTLSGTPTASGTFTFALSATDAAGVAGVASYALVVSARTAPTISDVADLSTAEDTPTSALAFTVADAETSAASLTVTATSSNQTLVPDANLVLGGSGANRTLTATPAANETGTTTITLTVTDGDTMTAVDTFVLTVNAVNDTPTISDVADRAIDEDTSSGALAFTIGDIETAATSLTVTRASSNTALIPLANVVLGGSGASRTVTITPAANQSGTATITLTVGDGTATATDTFVVTVNPVNDAPTISNVADVSVAEDTATAARPVTVGDLETAVGSLTLSGSSSNPTLVPDGNIAFGGSGANRTVTVTPAANQSGTATITLTVSDGALTATDTFVLTVTGANDAPTISTISAPTTDEDTATPALAFTVGDAETAAASLTVTGASSNTALVPNANLVFGGTGANRTVTVTPAANQSGTATITLTVSDGVATATSSFVLTVNAVNDTPTATAIPDTTINEDAATSALAFTIADVETAATSLVVTATSSNLTLVPNASLVLGGTGASRTLRVTPAANQSGTATITVSVSDGSASGTSSFLLTVNPANDAPTLTALANTSTAEDTATAALAFTVDDQETAAAVLSVSGTSSNQALVPDANLVFGGSGASRTLAITPASNQTGTATITVNVSDGVATGTRTFLLTVTAVNDAPVISALTDVSTPEDTATAAIPFSIGDVETAATALTISATSSNVALVPNGGLALGGSGANRSITATPAANQSGTTTITVTVSDGVATASSAFVLTVTAVNDAPTISNLADRSTNISTATSAIAFTIGDVETAATALTVSGTSSNLTLVPNAALSFGGSGTARTLVVTPAAGQVGTSTITVTVGDGTTTASDTFVLTVVNGAPTVSAIADTTIAEDASTAALAFTVADNETAGALLTVTGASDNSTLVPPGGIVFAGTGASRTVTVTPAANQSGTATITLTASDGVLTGSESFLLTVTAVNDVPVISNLPDTATDEDTATGSIAFTVSDVETGAGALTVTATSSNSALIPNANLALGGAGGNRTLVATPVANQSGTATITVTVSDGSATASDTFVLTVNAVNDAPTIGGIPDTTIAEDNATGALAFAVGDLETAATSLTLSAASSNPALVPTSAIVFGGSGASRTLVATPLANQSGTATITVTVSDGSATASDTFVLTVDAVNDAPTLGSLADRSTPLNTATPAVPITIADVETAAASLVVTATSSNTALVPNANLVLGGSGANRTLVATPAADQTGTTTVTVTVSDGVLTTSDAFVLTVSNGTPTLGAVADTTVDEDTPTEALAFTVADAETPAAALVVSGSSDNPALVPDANIVLGGSAGNRTVTVTPAANQSGTATITLSASDGLLTGATSFVLTVTPVNDAPSIGSLADTTVAEDTPTAALAFAVADVETAVASLTVTATSSNSALVPDANLVLGGSGAHRTLTATPVANQSGTATITVTVSDGVLTRSSQFVLTVTPVNDPPTLTSLPDTAVAEDTATAAIAFTVGDVETAASDLTLTATSSNSALVPDLNVVLGGTGAARTLTATPVANQSGTATITVTVSDGTATASDAFVLTVNAVNDAPIISDLVDIATPEDTPTSAIAFTVGDLETAAASLTIAATSSNTALVPNANLVLGGSGANRTLTVTPAANQSGTATITVTVGDGAATASDTFVLTVNAANDAPTLTAISAVTTAEDTASALAFTVGDLETAAGSLTVVATSSNTTLVPNANLALGGSGANRTLTVTPAADQSGTATITVTVSDGTATNSRSFVVTVTAVNDAPTLAGLVDTLTAEDTATAPLAFTLGDIDSAVGSLTVTATSSNLALVPAANLVLGGTGANRTLTLTPAANQFGTSTITVTVSDSAASTDRSFVLTVSGQNDAPLISDLADRTIAIDTATGALAFTIGDVETAAGSLTVSGTSSNLTLVPNANLVFGGTGASRTLTLTPAAGQTGTSTITVTVSDGTATTSDTFLLTVNNGAPTLGAIADTTVDEDATTPALAFTVADNETAATALTVTATSSNSTLVPHANLLLGGSGADRTLTLTPAADQSGTATITVTVSDGVLTASRSFLLTVAAVNDDPTLSDLADTTTNEDTPTAALAFTVDDLETAAASLTVTATSSNPALVPETSLVLGGSGANRTLVATPLANRSGTSTITVIVSDGTTTASDTFVLTVNAVNDAPTISDLADAATAEGAATSGLAFTVGDLETAADALTITTTSSNATLVPEANLVLGGSGANRTLVATPVANQSGTTTITVTVSDGALTASDTFVLTVAARLPTVSSPTSATLQSDTATLGGSVVADGGAGIVARGIVLLPAAAQLEPRLLGAGVVDFPTTGTTGVFTLAATGLTPSTTYVFAAYATNAVGTAYSPSATFTTAAPPAPTRLAQSISFDAPGDRVATDPAFTLSASASSGLPVTFVLVSGPAQLTGAELRLTGVAGEVVVRAVQTGNDRYEAAADVTRTFRVAPVSQQVFFGRVGESEADGLALVLDAEGRSGTLVGTIPGTGEAFMIALTVDDGGAWTASTETIVAENALRGSLSSAASPALAPQTRTFRGRVAAGVLTGSIDGMDATLRADRVSLSGAATAFAGGYRGVAPRTTGSRLTFVAGATGRFFALATADNYVASAFGTIDAGGAFAARTADGASFVGTSDAATGRLSGTLQRPGMALEFFMGLKFGVPRTDRLVNLSARGHVAAGERTLITGFVIAGTSPKRVLLRAVGPTLRGLGVNAALENPSLKLFDHTGGLLAENDDWSAGQAAEFARLGATPLDAASRDAALETTLAPGPYSVHVNGGEGVALAEIYDASVKPDAEPQRLVNLSSRGEAGLGENVLIGGFVITGNYPKRVLIRGVGPALVAHGVAGAVADPELKIFSGSEIVGQNDNWSAVPAERAAIEAASRLTGAFALAPDSRDAAILLRLAPGVYSAHVGPAGGGNVGVGLLEIYEVPEEE